MKAQNKLRLAVVAMAGVAVAVIAGGHQGWFSGVVSVSDTVTSDISRPNSVAVAALPVKKVEKLEIDLATKRAMIPGEGWISARDFWDIYYNQPEKLPGDIDFDLVRQLEQLTLGDRAAAEQAFNQLQQDPAADDMGLDMTIPGN